MNARARFLRTMRYEPVDRVPVLALEPFEAPAIARWHTEGLPADESPAEFLGMDEFVYVGGTGIGPDPPFEHRVVYEDGEVLVETTTLGATVRRDKAAPTTFYGHIDHPIKSPADWAEYKRRLKPDSPGRQSLRDADTVRRLEVSENPVGICIFPFFFRFGFYTMGMERFLTAFHDEPAMMHDMFATGSRLLMSTLSAVLSQIRIDFALFNEDLAGKNGPLISPRTYAQFWHPHQDPILELLRAHNVPVICQWSAGQLGALLPDMLDHGFNCTWPLERMAGMDALGLRQEYGQDLRLGGNIAKEAVLAGRDAIDKEVDRLLPLVRDGGFIPALDDMAPAECPFELYRYHIERLKGI